MAAAPEMGCCLKRALVFVAACASLHAATYCVTVAGLGGEPDYEQRFAAWAKDIDKTMKAVGPDVKVESLYGADATKAKLQAALDRVAKEAKPADAVVLMIIGHGTFDGTDYKINLPGPDASATDLAGWLDRIPAQRQLVVNMTSASGASVHALQKPSRVVITATKTGTEKNATVFARYWVDALRDASADTDKNEVISAFEAYKYAEQKTKQFYESQKRIATEHPTLTDGDQPTAMNAARFSLLRLGSIQQASKDPAKQALLAKREELEGSIEKLKAMKPVMPPEEYKKQLSALLLQLAQTQADLDK